MISIKNKQAILKMKTAGKLLAKVLHDIKPLVKAGVTTLQLDAWIENEFRKNHLGPRTKGYKGYKHVSCISLNDEVVHGVPSDKKVLKNGDIVKIDLVASWKGYCADTTRSFFVGEVPEKVRDFVRTARIALNKGIEKAVAGNYLSDISHAIQKEVERNGFSVVRDLAGHGIGKNIHEDPEVLNYGEPGEGPILREGMTLAIEPMITMGKYDIYVAKDGWTIKTVDKSLAAHEEDTVLITQNKPKVLTIYEK
jgi:methionyl aminopeptidase